MIDIDRERFARCIALLAVAARVQADELLIEAYWIALRKQGIQHVEGATELALEEVVGMPSTAELRELCKRLAREEYMHREVLPPSQLEAAEVMKRVEAGVSVMRRRLGRVERKLKLLPVPRYRTDCDGSSGD